MSHRIDPNLLPEIKAYGPFEIESCFNCGNCTAVCSLTTSEDSFPRKLIRYAQLGLREELVGSKELWLCYNCGECSETCPRQAEPASFMMAARSYAISRYDIFGISKQLTAHPVLGSLLLSLLFAILGLFMYSNRGPMATESMKLFDFIPYHLIHNLGMGVIIAVSLLGLVVIGNMLVQLSDIQRLSLRSFTQIKLSDWARSLWETIAVQVLGQKRYRQSCEETKPHTPWYLSKWFVHASALWGFLGLLTATILDYLLDIVGLKPTGTLVPVWYPIRLIGTVAGLFLVYGVSVLIGKRLRPTDKAHSNSSFSDWSFLWILWLSGFTGFIVELSLYLQPSVWGYWMLIVHIAISMELVLLLPFTKFAHAILRTTALLVHALKPQPVTQVAEQPVAAD